MQGRGFFQISLCGSPFDSCQLGPDVIEDECGDEEANKDNLTFQTVDADLAAFTSSNLRGLGCVAVSTSDVSQRIGQGPDSRSQQHNILDQKLARRRGERGKSIPCLPYSWRRNDKTQRS